MIRELINFTKYLDEDFKNLAYKPSKGLHIIITYDENRDLKIENYQYYNGSDELNDFLQQALFYERYSSYISMNQQQKFDKKQKIHSSSPFSIAFNFSFGNPENKKKIETELKSQIFNKNNNEILNKEEKEIIDFEAKKLKLNDVKERLFDYFKNAIKLCFENISNDINLEVIKFNTYCKDKFFDEILLLKIDDEIALQSLKEKDYVRVYFDEISKDLWISAYEHYFNTEYPQDELQESDFITTFSDKKTFLTHKTATFDVSSKITGVDSKILKEFKELLSIKNPRILPNPLPIFIFKDELQQRSIGIFKESGFRISYKDIVEKLIIDFQEDFGNYYLLNWSMGKDIRINDFDYIPKFNFNFQCQILNYFEIKSEGIIKPNIEITNVFEFETFVFIPLIGNKYNKIDYFKELDSEDYNDRTKSPNKIYNSKFVSYTKYRKSAYDFVYKSFNRIIKEDILYEMVFNAIIDDLKYDNSFSIKEKLNIWFSLYEQFSQNNKNEKSMASKLKDYQEYVGKIILDQADFNLATDEQFMFAAGQVINYILTKSKSADQSYQLLEPYTQKSSCKEFQKAIANDFARYKHANYSGNFERAASFVLTYETDQNLKNYLPELLAGVFSKNQLFSLKKEVPSQTSTN